MIIGEAPGIMEISKRKPFVGPSGKLLWSTIRSALAEMGKESELSPENIYVTNSLLCMPAGKGAISKSAVKACRGRLLEEIKLVEPDVILVLGATALQSVTGDMEARITRVNGILISEEPKTVACFHPAAVLRSSAEYNVFEKSVQYAVQLWQGGKIRKPEPTHTPVISSLRDAMTLVRYLLRKARRTNETLYWSADIETTGFNHRIDSVLCLSLSWAPGRAAVIADEFLPYAKPLFDLPNVRWIWHNGKFDTPFLQDLGFHAEVHEDTMLLSYCLDETPGRHDLKTLSSRLLGADDYETVLHSYLPSTSDSFSIVPRDILFEYSAYDADYTRQLYKVLRPKVREDSFLDQVYRRILIPGQALLRKVEQNGLVLDLAETQKQTEIYEQQLVEVDAQINDIIKRYWNAEEFAQSVGAKKIPTCFNPGSPKQLAWLLYDCLNMRPKGLKGDSTDAKALKLIQEQKPNILVDTILKRRRIAKVLSTYLVGLRKHLDDDSRIRSTFLIHGSATGRLASRNPNLQNIPRESTVRNIFRASDGCTFIEADYKSHELRCLAYLSNDEALTAVFLQGLDLHDEVAKALYGPNFTKDQRVRAKAVNFGIPYGRSAASISEEYHMDQREGVALIDNWFKRFPGAHDYILRCRESVLTGRALISPFGRKRRFGVTTPENIVGQQNEAANFAIQSMASDLTLLTAIRIYDELLSKFGAKIVNLIHDSIMVELRNDPELIKQVAPFLVEEMRKTPRIVLGTEFPFDADCKSGEVWGSMKEYKIEEE